MNLNKHSTRIPPSESLHPPCELHQLTAVKLNAWCTVKRPALRKYYLLANLCRALYNFQRTSHKDRVSISLWDEQASVSIFTEQMQRTCRYGKWEATKAQLVLISEALQALQELLYWSGPSSTWHRGEEPLDQLRGWPGWSTPGPVTVFVNLRGGSGPSIS